MAFLGKEFTLHSQENFDKFVMSLKGPDNIKQDMINRKDTIKLAKNGDQYTISIAHPSGGIKDVTFSSGVGIDEEIQGIKSRTTFTVNGNVVTHEIAFPDGNVTTITREFSADQVVATYKTSDSGATAKKIYK